MYERISSVLLLLAPVALASVIARSSVSAQPYSQDIGCWELWDELDAIAEDESVCRSSRDCASIDLPPPLGCRRPVSKDGAQILRTILRSYAHACGISLYNCYGPTQSVWCEDGRCVNKLRRGGGLFPSTGTRNQFGRPLR